MLASVPQLQRWSSNAAPRMPTIGRLIDLTPPTPRPPTSRLSNSCTSRSAWFGQTASYSISPLASVTSTPSFDASPAQLTTWHTASPSPTLVLALIPVSSRVMCGAGAGCHRHPADSPGLRGRPDLAGDQAEALLARLVLPGRHPTGSRTVRPLVSPAAASSPAPK